MKKTIALAAVCATAISPILTAPAFAADPNTDTADTMQSACNTFVNANYGPTIEDEDGTYYTFEVVHDGGTEAAPVFDPLSRINDEESWTPDLTSVQTLNGPDASDSTQLVRSGKSPNIFATDVRASSETWSNNSVDYTIEFTVTTTFAYQCDVTQVLWTPPVPPTPPSGAFYDWEHIDNPGQNDCSRLNDGPVGVGRPGVVGDRHGNCVLVEVTFSNPGDDGEDGFHTDVGIGPVGDFTIDETSDPVRTDPITDTMAGPHTYFDTDALGHAVVCISPGSKGGTWRAQNQYPTLPADSPRDCSTDTFNSLPGGIIPSNSLPVT